jgi:hypothetical protein
MIMTCDMKLGMYRSDSAIPPLGAVDTAALPALPLLALRDLACAVSSLQFGKPGTSPSLAYSHSDANWKFTDPCPSGRPILIRNAVAQDGEVFDVRSFSPHALRGSEVSAVCISRTVTSLGEECLAKCRAVQIVVFEGGSHLGEIGRLAFCYCRSLQSIAIPCSVGLLLPHCFCACESLRSVTFERPSRLATIGDHAFLDCRSLNRLFLPASVAAIGRSAFAGSGITSIEIAKGSVSFRVVKELLVDFEVRALVWVIGSPESIHIPSSIEELRPSCCYSKTGLRRVEFSSDSNLRSIGRLAFGVCESLESICIPSSVEVLGEDCFQCCSNLRRVTFGSESRLRLIEHNAFYFCRSLSAVTVSASVEVIGTQRGISVSRP